MAYHVLPKRLAQLGFCCAWEYFNATKGSSTTEIARELKVHLRTARRWRSKWRADTISCNQAMDCFQKIPAQYPYPVESSDESLPLLPLVQSDEDLL